MPLLLPRRTDRRPSRCRARLSNRGQRGAVIVEAALVLPVMVLLIVGIIEMGLLFTSYSTTTASSRSGARLAATSYAPAGSSASAQRAAADQISLATAADLKVLNNATPIGMAVYKVNPASADGAPYGGFPGPNMAGGCTTDCIRYQWDASTDELKYVSGTWASPDACGVEVDSIGVVVQSQHHYITSFIGESHTVNGHTVMRLEPLPTDACGA